jgi:hypothetical protein
MKQGVLTIHGKCKLEERHEKENHKRIEMIQ